MELPVKQPTKEIMQDSKAKKTISVRLDPAEYAKYEDLVGGAGLSVSEGLRILVAQKLQSATTVGMKGFTMDCIIKWNEPKPSFPELVGSMLLKVTPPKGMSEEELQRLVFTIPEFFTDTGKQEDEQFRIDSAYFNRVTHETCVKTSSRTNRNVLSFHLLKNCWHAGVFQYSSSVSFAEMEKEIKLAIEKHLRQTVLCYLIGQLPESRLLPAEVLMERYEVIDPLTLENIGTI
jgi:hypothetical protein